MFTQRPLKYLSETRCTPVIERSLQGSSSVGKLRIDQTKKYVFMYMLCVVPWANMPLGLPVPIVPLLF
jgi:hypothetical protein